MAMGLTQMSDAMVVTLGKTYRVSKRDTEERQTGERGAAHHVSMPFSTVYSVMESMIRSMLRIGSKS